MNRARKVTVLIGTAVVLLAAPARAAADRTQLGAEIIGSSGVKGGLCVHLGATDGRLTADLAAGGKFLVHGLTAEAAYVEKARKHIQSRGVYGKVSVEHCSLKKLPYSENLVNLVVVDDLPRLLSKGLSLKEVLRVLTPGGVAYLGVQDARKISASALRRKLRAGGIREFEEIRRFGLWAKVVKPRPVEMDEWTHWRHGPDGNMVSNDTIVGIPSRLKWIVGPTWARTHAVRGCSRAMVSARGRVFYVYDEAPRGLTGPMRLTLTARDAFNGVLLWKRPIESASPLEPVKDKSRYYWYKRRSLVAVADRVYSVLKQGGPLVALDAASGAVIKTYDRVGSPWEVVRHEGRLVLIVRPEPPSSYARVWGFGSLVCVDEATGAVKWKVEDSKARYLIIADGQVFYESSSDVACLDLRTGREKWRKKRPDGARVLCFYKDGRLFMKGAGKNLYAVSASDGSPLWTYDYTDFNGQWYSDTEVYSVGGLVWVQVGGESWAMVGLDPATGAEKKRVDFPAEYPKTRGHHRCHPNKATKRYFILDTHGLDFVDWQAGKVCDLRVYRGNCYFGVLPANGLLYLPPNACQCGEYFRGLMALQSTGERGPVEVKAAADDRFERGPAFGSTPGRPGAPGQDEWPCYRHDPRRSGSTSSKVPHDIKLLWQRDIGGRITSPTVAEGMVFLAATDAHQVLAFDARTGGPRWSFTAGGRVDTPPTIHAGRALFGCRNGWVYCLRARDGKLVWRFRAAPRDRRLVAFGQLESVWPVNGSVLLHNGTAFFSAGWSSELDGGIYVYAADPGSGKVIWERRTPSSLGEIIGGKVWKGYVPVCLNDILIGDGSSVSVRQVGFDTRTGEVKLPRYPWWARSGMLDESSWVGRIRWRGPRTRAELLVFDSESTYGVLTTASKDRAIAPGKSEYKLFAKGAREWSLQVPVRVNAMVLAAKTLFAAGVPDVVDEKDYWAAFDGKKGGELWAVSAADGRRLHSLKLEAPPVFDGMAAAGGRLYLATKDGKLRCFGKK